MARPNIGFGCEIVRILKTCVTTLGVENAVETHLINLGNNADVTRDRCIKIL